MILLIIERMLDNIDILYKEMRHWDFNEGSVSLFSMCSGRRKHSNGIHAIHTEVPGVSEPR